MGQVDGAAGWLLAAVLCVAVVAAALWGIARLFPARHTGADDVPTDHLDGSAGPDTRQAGRARDVAERPMTKGAR